MNFNLTRLRRILNEATSRSREESGMAAVVAVAMMTAALLITTATFATVFGDIPLAKGDQDRKQAYLAAEAGISFYQYHLDQDVDYWKDCTNVPAPSASELSPVNQQWNGTGTDPRNWRTITGSNAQYTIELLPATGYSTCVQNTDASMIDAATNTFKIRSTGKAGNAKRSIVATFKRKGFLDYLYFTDYETQDPAAYSTAQQQQDASDDCVEYHSTRPSSCVDIQFASADNVAGPLHSNDSILICGTPTFGRTSADAIEATSWWDKSSCNGSPNFLGTWKPNATAVSLPTTNSNLQTLAQTAYKYTGTTTIVLNGANMTVTNAGLSPTTQTVAFPSNGLVYVKSGTCTTSYQRKQQYNDAAGCPIVNLSGSYTTDLTIASEGDIVIKGNVLRSPTDGTALLGLIPYNFARIYHPVNNWNSSATTCDNATGTMNNVEVDAAILALNHSFIVDNWYCGADLDTLTVKGAIAQKFRGPVGTGGGSSGSGYAKDYEYDDNFQYRDPPSFLNPVQSSWTIRRYVEQSPAR